MTEFLDFRDLSEEQINEIFCLVENTEFLLIDENKRLAVIE